MSWLNGPYHGVPATGDHCSYLQYTLSAGECLIHLQSRPVVDVSMPVSAASLSFAVVAMLLGSELHSRHSPLALTDRHSETVGSYDSCRAIAIAESILYAITTPAAALLFYFRVSAVYANNKLAVVLFTLCWLAVAACYAYDAANGLSEFAHSPNSQHCDLVFRGREGATSYTAVAVYDTIVFAAISWRVLSHLSTGDCWKSRLGAFFGGQGLYKLSRVLLSDGQLYYL